MSANALAELAAVDLYGSELVRAAASPPSATGLRVISRRGEEQPLALARYLGPSAAEESGVLARAAGPVLDVGCGPGRHVVALSRLGVMALGLDISPLAVRLARRRGARVIQASIFDRIPGTGSWGSALLLDGNIGIGGEPAELLGRIGDLLRDDGLALVEVEPPGVPTRSLTISLETDRARSEWFPWARLGIDGLDETAERASFRVVERWHVGSRWFAALARPSSGLPRRAPQRL